MSNEIQRVEPPAIPLASRDYSRQVADQTHNVFRLFFNRITSLLGLLLSPDAGGKFLYMPHGKFADTTTQTAASANTAYVITYNTVGDNTNISLVSNSQITVADSGIFLFNVYAHVDTTGNSGDLTLWASVNGTNLDNSGRRVNASADNPIQFSGTLLLEAGDYVEFYWEVTSTNVQLATVGAGANYPSVPSVSVSVSFAGNG